MRGSHKIVFFFIRCPAPIEKNKVGLLTYNAGIRGPESPVYEALKTHTQQTKT